jgi:site-specific DNA-methyltransferase (adenine-specific)
MFELYNADSIVKMKDFADDSIDLIVTDPPYPITKKGCAGTMGGMMTTQSTKQGKIFQHNEVKISDYAPEFYRVLKDGSHCYVMTNHVNLIEMLNTFTEQGFHFIKSLIWDKGNKITGRFYMSQFEYILFFRKGSGKQINHCGTSDILAVPNKKIKGHDGKNLHDTEKPIGLMKILIENSSQPNEVVLDPFMGIGTTGVACKKLGRNFIGIEKDEKYFNIAKDRIDSFTTRSLF